MTVTECADILRAENSITILTHIRPDGDTLCSAAALCSALRRLGKNAGVLKNKGITETYAPFVDALCIDAPYEGSFFVSVDVASEGMLLPEYSGGVDLCIDHHGSNSLYAKKTLVDAQMAACGEIVMLLIEELCGRLSLQEAELLYIAVSTDCGCFCYGNTSPRTLRDAAHLIEYGVRNAYLNKLLFRSFSFERLTLEGMIFSTMRSYRGNKINVAVITLDMMERSGATEDDCDDLASLAGRVRGNVVAITIRELRNGASKASVRTTSEVNASDICARLGGGGHPMAAGCTVEMRPAELADKLIEIVDDIWK